MNEDKIKEVLSRPRWSEKQLNDAARGKAIGSCVDPPDIEFQFWLEMARDEAERKNTNPKQRIAELVEQAYQGLFE